ncbi:MAG: MFS transporter [Gammaproteobacteria bacterium]|nr:MFS transporter [Gammaproteobacteria bacterium]
MTKTRLGINATLLAIMAEGLASRFSFGIIGFALPLYAHQLGLSVAEIGFLISVNFAVAMLLKPMMGRLADRRGFKRCLVFALAARSLVSLLFALAWLPWQLYAIRIGQGASRSLRDPAIHAIIAERSAKDALATSFAWYGTVKSIAGKLGYGLAGILLAATTQDFALVFTVSAVLSLIAIFVVWRFVPASKENLAASSPLAIEDADQAEEGSPDNTLKEHKAEDQPPLAKPRIWSIMMLGFLMSGSAKMIGGLFPLLAVEYGGLTVAQTGSIYLLGAVVILIAGPGFGLLSDRVSRRLVLLIRSIANVTSSVVFMVAPNLAGMIGGYLIDETGKAAFRPAWGALMAENSDLDRRNRAYIMAKLSLGEEAGAVMGPLFASLVWNTWGVIAMLAARIVLAVVSEIYAIVVTKSYAADAEPQREVHARKERQVSRDNHK